MGNVLSWLDFLFTPSFEARVALLGLDACGKTTLLYNLKLGEVVTTVPTIGFNVETVTIGQLQMVVWDVGGQDKIRALWGHYLENMNGLIFMIDKVDKERVEDAKTELHKLLQNEHIKKKNIPVLILINKIDLARGVDFESLERDIRESFKYKKNKFICRCVATQKDDHFREEGFKWLEMEMKPPSTSWF